LWLNDTYYTARKSEGTNRNLPARNTLVQLLALCNESTTPTAIVHSVTDRQTHDTTMPVADGTSFVAVRSAKNSAVDLSSTVFDT